MTDTNDRQHRSILQRIAHRVMLERRLAPAFAPQALADLDDIYGPATRVDKPTRDHRNLLWCSIGNDDSRDLDQFTVAEAMPDGAKKVLVAVADVDAVVKKRSALDDHARHNTTSVYTVAETFPMLPETLSTDIASLNYESDRLAIVIVMVFTGDARFRVRTSMRRQSVIVQSLPTTALPVGSTALRKSSNTGQGNIVCAEKRFSSAVARTHSLPLCVAHTAEIAAENGALP